MPRTHTEIRIKGVRRVAVHSSYTGLAKELVRLTKFDRAQAGCSLLARAISRSTVLPKGYILVPVTTASYRRRQRGYDQAVLIAKYLSRMSGNASLNVLVRVKNVRQLGSSRTKRIQQLDQAYRLTSPELIKGQRIILIDDVVTTGATLASAASTLLEAGALSVDAAVFAQA